jgi:cell division protease FtsH
LLLMVMLLLLQVGHALVSTAVSKLVANSGAVAKLSIIPRTGGALGFTYIPPSTGDSRW